MEFPSKIVNLTEFERFGGLLAAPTLLSDVNCVGIGTGGLKAATVQGVEEMFAVDNPEGH